MDINHLLSSVKNDVVFRIGQVLSKPLLFYYQQTLTPAHLLAQKSREESMLFFEEKMKKALLFETHQQVWQNVARLVIKHAKQHNFRGLFLEFGVFQGISTNFFASVFRPHGIKLTGFDAFLGLEEEWTGAKHSPEEFNRQGKPPKLENNVDIKIGWVQDTLPEFLASQPAAPCFFAHLDFDTYTPTKFALEQIKSRLVPGSIILFDELYAYPGWRDHEYKALIEVFDESDYEYIVFGPMQVAIQMK